MSDLSDLLPDTAELKRRGALALQAKVLRALDRHVERTLVPPTLAELAKALGYKSTTSVVVHLSRLEERGLVTVTGDGARTHLPTAWCTRVRDALKAWDERRCDSLESQTRSVAGLSGCTGDGAYAADQTPAESDRATCTSDVPISQSSTSSPASEPAAVESVSVGVVEKKPKRQPKEKPEVLAEAMAGFVARVQEATP